MGTSAFGGFCVSRRFCLTRKDADKGAEERGSARIDALEKRKKERRKEEKKGLARISVVTQRTNWFGLSASFRAFFRVLPRQILTGPKVSRSPATLVPIRAVSVFIRGKHHPWPRMRIRGTLRAYAFRGTDAEAPHNSSGRLRRPAAAMNADLNLQRRRLCVATSASAAPTPASR